MISIVIGTLSIFLGLFLLQPILRDLRNPKRRKSVDPTHFKTAPIEIPMPSREAPRPFMARERDSISEDFGFEAEPEIHPTGLSGAAPSPDPPSPFEKIPPPRRIGFPAVEDEDEDDEGSPRQETLGF